MTHVVAMKAVKAMEFFWDFVRTRPLGLPIYKRRSYTNFKLNLGFFLDVRAMLKHALCAARCQVQPRLHTCFAASRPTLYFEAAFTVSLPCSYRAEDQK